MNCTRFGPTRSKENSPKRELPFRARTRSKGVQPRASAIGTISDRIAAATAFGDIQPGPCLRRFFGFRVGKRGQGSQASSACTIRASRAFSLTNGRRATHTALSIRIVSQDFMVADLTEWVGDDSSDIAGQEVVDAIAISELVIRSPLIPAQPSSGSELLLAHQTARRLLVQNGVARPVIHLDVSAARQWPFTVRKRSNTTKGLAQLALGCDRKAIAVATPRVSERRGHISASECCLARISPVHRSPVQHILDH